MRPDGILKLGFYPTPSAVLTRLREVITVPPRGVHALDPCCGAGEALASLTESRGAATYGVELHAERAKSAEQILGKVVHASLFETAISPGAFGLILLNPPYDARPGGRLESRFLRMTKPKLAPGGVLIYIIPEGRLDTKTHRYLLSYFDPVVCAPFPAPDYDRFSQIVVVARRAFQPLDYAGRAVKWINSIEKLRPFGFTAGATEGPAVFTRREELERELGRLICSSRALVHAEDAISDVPPVLPTPLMPLRKGLIVMLLLGGFLDNTIMKIEGKRYLVKGFARKKVVKMVRDEKTIERQVAVCGIGLLNLDDGEFVEVGL